MSTGISLATYTINNNHPILIQENELAKAALLEAGRLARTGHISPEGRKKIRYGTRSLTILPKEISHG